MPRRRRVHLDAVPLHIVQRGHNREPCFFDEQDYHAYLQWLGEALVREDCALHAYVLMTNQVHLLVTPASAESIPRVIIAVGRRYVQYVNHSYRRTGTLWDSRYKSSLVQAETYLLSCQRYIEMNPVRAAMVADPAEYPWSSYRHHALGVPNDILSPHDLYTALGHSDLARQQAYRALSQALIAYLCFLLDLTGTTDELVDEGPGMTPVRRNQHTFEAARARSAREVEAEITGFHRAHPVPSARDPRIDRLEPRANGWPFDLSGTADLFLGLASDHYINGEKRSTYHPVRNIGRIARFEGIEGIDALFRLVGSQQRRTRGRETDRQYRFSTEHLGHNDFSI